MKRIFIGALVAVVWSAQAADLPAEAGLQDVEALGRLNGTALACAYAAVAARIKTGMVQHAPKTAQHGEAFSQKTHEAYLSMQQGAVCPGEREILEQAEPHMHKLQQLNTQP